MARAQTKRSPWDTRLMERDRLALGWTQADLAHHAGISAQTVGRFFAGSFQSPKSAKRIALALGHPITRYLKGSTVAA